MKKFISFCAIIALAFLPLSAETLQKGKTIVFSMQDHLDLPTYTWPESLVGYRVEFSPAISGEADLVLENNLSGGRVALQLTDAVKKDGKISSATVNFITGLAQGDRFSYSLKYAERRNDNEWDGCSLEDKGTEFSSCNGPITLTLPKSDCAQLMKLESREFRVGAESVLDAGALPVRSRRTRVIESGPLMVKFESEFVLGGDGARYSVVFTLVKGYPFVIIEEKADGIGLDKKVGVDLVWNNIDFKYRFSTMWDRTIYPGQPSWLPIDKPVYTNFSKEDPFWSGQGMIEDPSERMIFRLASFGGNSVREQTPLISFWGDGPAEVGTFVFDHDKWDDLQYGIWQQTPDLSVYFRYRDGKLHFMYPIASGSRSTAVAVHDRQFGESESAAFAKAMDETGGDLKSRNTRFRYMNLLHSRYALLGLDRVKDWKLEYPESGLRKEFHFGTDLSRTSPDMFMKEMLTSPMSEYMCGLNGYPGIHSIAHRKYYGRLIQGYQMNYDKLTVLQRQQVEALFLIAGYVNMLEAMNAIRTCLAGTANMASDGWVVPGFNAAMFPEHKMAPVWREFYEKSLEIYGLFYTRPDVREYESKGGRWAESLGIYNWAYLKPTLTAAIALQSTFGTNSFANQYMASRGYWMVNMLTAPVLVARKAENEPSLQRVYTAHGAHSSGRFVEQFSLLYEYGKFMENYDPILAENIYWCGKFGQMPEGKKGDTNWDEVFMANNDTKNSGTNPHLKSDKYTGHGIVLRAGVDTSEELSIHLDQVDKGPNYRWGNQGEGNSGGIYFYAGGKIYSGHENESAGDHVQNDLDNVCNMGVMKDGRYQTVGYNELTAPLYDFGFAQYAEVRSVDAPHVSSWPEYESRSVMLAGTDYFVIYDQTGTNWRASARFSWFVRNEDNLPNIVFFGPKARTDHWTKASTWRSHGFYRDAAGPQLTLVTHKSDVLPLGGKLTQPDMLAGMPVYEFVNANRNYPYIGVHEIQTSSGRDVVFRNKVPISCREKFYSFTGEAGIARKKADGEIQLAIFKGEAISFGQFGMTLEHSAECAVGLRFTNPGAVEGEFQNYGEAALLVRGVTGGSFYIDGMKVESDGTRISLPKGKHHLEYTASATARPMPSNILATEHTKNGCVIVADKHPSAQKLVVELSSDSGQTWKAAGEMTGTEYALTGLKKGKYHVRVVSVNGERRADEAPEYPVYVKNSAPHYPDGLQLRVHDGIVDISWGKVLGVRKYLLYRRLPGEERFNLIYEGDHCRFADKFPGAEKCDPQPSDVSGGNYTRYYVVAENGCGRSAASPEICANPSSWKTWYPATVLRFKRRSAFWAEPYVYPSQMPQMYYPD